MSADPHADERAEIDRCGRCGGLFLEFFDGEPSALSRGLIDRADLEPAPRPAPEGSLTCPDCEAPMVERAYLGHGPSLPRCETCLAVFLTPALREELATLTLPPSDADEETGWLDRALEWLRRLG